MSRLSDKFAELLKKPDRSFTLVGEDRGFGGNGLFVDLIPSTCWFSNVRTCIRPRDWTLLRHKIYARAGGKCECCGSEPGLYGRSLEAHERWMYTTRTGVQKLMRIIALCKMCHTATHMSLADGRGMGDRARAHLMRVRKIDRDEMDDHYKLATTIWGKRSDREWKLDLSIITDSGIELREPRNAGERRPMQAQPGERAEGEPECSDTDDDNDDGAESQEEDSQPGSDNQVEGRPVSELERVQIPAHRSMQVSGNKYTAAVLVGLRRRYGSEPEYTIEITINRKQPKSNNSYRWWLRPITATGDVGSVDRRVPVIPAHRRFNVRCRLRAGRYVVGCGSASSSGISYEFTVNPGGRVVFHDE